MTPIVLATNPDRQAYVDHFMKDVSNFFRDYVYVASTWNGELGAIEEGSNLFNVFALLQDTHVVNNWGQFMIDLSLYKAAYIMPRPSCYAMVYDSSIIRKMYPLPLPGQDKEAMIANETLFCDEYERLAREYHGDVPVLYPEMTDGDALSHVRYYDWMPDGPDRLHLRSSCGTLSKMKRTYR